MSDNPNPPVQADAVTPDEFLTWDDLSVQNTKRKFVPKYNKWIEYRRFVPLDELARYQAAYLAGDKKDYFNYFLALLRFGLINPAITSDDALRAVRKSDGGLLQEIISDMVSSKEAAEISAGLGEG